MALKKSELYSSLWSSCDARNRAGREIIVHPEADRVHIVFAQKPERSMIDTLKGQGWPVRRETARGRGKSLKREVQRPPDNRPWLIVAISRRRYSYPVTPPWSRQP